MTSKDKVLRTEEALRVERALKLALEALECDPLDMALNPDGHMGFRKDQAITAIREALAKSQSDVEQPAQQEPVAWMFQHEETGRMMCVDAQQVEWGFEKGNPRLKKIAPLYTSPPAQQEEPEQSEIFCGVDFADGLLSVSVLRRRADDVAELLHLEQITLPAQQQEPFGYFRYDLRLDAWVQNREGRPGTPFYTSPPNVPTARASKSRSDVKPWVGLTDEQINEFFEGMEPNNGFWLSFARAIEAKLREKNEHREKNA